MRLHPQEVDLHIQAFHAIACLGTAGKDNSEHEHFLEITMRCLKSYDDDVDLVSAALHAVGALAGSSEFFLPEIAFSWQLLTVYFLLSHCICTSKGKSGYENCEKHETIQKEWHVPNHCLFRSSPFIFQF